MLLVRFSRKQACEINALSRHILALPIKSHHSSKKCEAYLSKFSYLTSRFHHNLSRFQLRCYSTETFDTSKTLDFSEAEKSSNLTDSCPVEHHDNTNYSEKDVEQYRERHNITVRGDDIPKPIMHFNDLPLPEVLKEVLGQENYSEPTPIQAQGWPVAFSGRDMVGVSQTGSGKTLAYMLPAVVHAGNVHSKYQRRNDGYDIPSPKVLILGPTRELVQQILQVSKRYIQASHLRGACVYGGASRVPQLQHLQGADICVATPGRLLDYLENRETSLKSCSYLVLDEADRMLDMGFEPQIREIIDNIPNDRQTLMWSATWPKEIRNLAEDFLSNYIHVTVGDTDLVANPNIEQNVYIVNEESKFEKFCSFITDILQSERSKVLVFAETKRKVHHLTHLLKEQGIDAWGIHGDCTQSQRDRILRDFRRSSSSVLIATDIASRGLDITDINHVFNYDFPTNIEDYIHRIGRTARGSAGGKSHSFFTQENCGVLNDLLTVLRKANQKINPELYTLIESSSSKFYKPKNRYNYNASYGKNKMFYGNNKASYNRNKFNDDRNRMKYRRDRMSYGGT